MGQTVNLLLRLHRFESCSSHLFALIAQLAEQLTCNQQVVCSNHTWSSKDLVDKRSGLLNQEVNDNYCRLLLTMR